MADELYRRDAEGNWHPVSAVNRNIIEVSGEGILIKPDKLLKPMDLVSYTTSHGIYSGNLIPTMTSAAAPSGIVTSSGDYSSTYAAWKAFDKSNSTYWRASVEASWIAYEFTTPKIISMYSVRAYSSYRPTAWTFEGWDGTDWVLLHSPSGAANSSYVAWVIDNTTAYIKYRMNITNVENDYQPRIYEIGMMERLL